MGQKYHRQYSFEGNCGQHALVHALGCLGIHISIGEAHRRTGVSRLRAMIEGSDKHGIMRGIRRSGCRSLPHLVHGELKARKTITRYLGQGFPVIILIDEEDHWMVLSGMKGERFKWIDSVDERLTGSSKWKTIAGWMGYGAGGSSYYFIVAAKNR
jgi:ABC-type bacteriocin/lantibiotic exporter with double-glycine peptidase domain